MEQKFVTYEQFGAKGDGMTDDMPAIVACHEYANANGLDVVARDGANYYIGGRDMPATVRTSVHWGEARFTVDDRELENIYASIFRVMPDGEHFCPDLPPLRRGQKRVDFPHKGCVLARVTDSSRPVYIRKGLNKNNGTPTVDSFVVDGEGNIIGDINWDYDSYTEVSALPVDDRPIIIEGGIFTTVANQQQSFYNYHARNISISRSHVTVQNLTHYVTDEGDHGAPYRGFLSIESAWDVTVRDCLLTPHMTYYTPSKIPGQMVPMGSYDLNLNSSIGVRVLRLRQTIDITDKRYWGLMGSNFCKDYYMEDCIISRFDAHMGVTNCTIKNCELGHMGVNLIGFGEALIEGTTFRAGRTVNFRSDYGSFFHGKLTLRDCTWIPTHLSSRRPAEILVARNEGDHDFGYACGMPAEIVIDGLLIDDTALEDPALTYTLFPNYDADFCEGKPYPYGTPKTVRTKDIRSASGREIIACADAKQYPHLTDLTIS